MPDFRSRKHFPQQNRKHFPQQETPPETKSPEDHQRQPDHRRNEITGRSGTTGRSPEDQHSTTRSSGDHRHSITGGSSELYLTSMLYCNYWEDTSWIQHWTATAPEDHRTTGRSSDTTTAPEIPRDQQEPPNHRRPQEPNRKEPDHRQIRRSRPPKIWSPHRIIIAINQTKNGADRKPGQQPPPEIEYRRRK